MLLALSHGVTRSSLWRRWGSAGRPRSAWRAATPCPRSSAHWPGPAAPPAAPAPGSARPLRRTAARSRSRHHTQTCDRARHTWQTAGTAHPSCPAAFLRLPTTPQTCPAHRPSGSQTRAQWWAHVGPLVSYNTRPAARPPGCVSVRRRCWGCAWRAVIRRTAAGRQGARCTARRAAVATPGAGSRPSPPRGGTGSPPCAWGNKMTERMIMTSVFTAQPYSNTRLSTPK